jgi:hypothetical protein
MGSNLSPLDAARLDGRAMFLGISRSTGYEKTKRNSNSSPLSLLSINYDTLHAAIVYLGRVAEIKTAEPCKSQL